MSRNEAMAYIASLTTKEKQQLNELLKRMEKNRERTHDGG